VPVRRLGEYIQYIRFLNDMSRSVLSCVVLNYKQIINKPQLCYGRPLLRACTAYSSMRASQLQLFVGVSCPSNPSVFQ
jgi:hypothetical protein